MTTTNRKSTLSPGLGWSAPRSWQPWSAKLGELKLLSVQDAREVYDEALLLLERQQAASAPSKADGIFVQARRIIETQTRDL